MNICYNNSVSQSVTETCMIDFYLIRHFMFLRNNRLPQMEDSTEIQSSNLMSMSLFNFSVHLWI